MTFFWQIDNPEEYIYIFDCDEKNYPDTALFLALHRIKFIMHE